MNAKAIQRFARITPRKCNQVLDLIRGQSVEQAQTTLQFTPKYGARLVQKVLKSAVSNALQQGKVRVEDLYVREAVVGAGPTLKRWLPRAQGRATPLLKRTSHVVVTDSLESAVGMSLAVHLASAVSGAVAAGLAGARFLADAEEIPAHFREPVELEPCGPGLDVALPASNPLR